MIFVSGTYVYIHTAHVGYMIDLCCSVGSVQANRILTSDMELYDTSVQELALVRDCFTYLAKSGHKGSNYLRKKLELL